VVDLESNGNDIVCLKSAAEESNALAIWRSGPNASPAGQQALARLVPKPTKGQSFWAVYSI
jgi:hypothetical protein